MTLGDRTELVWGSALFLSPSAAGGPTHMVDGKSRGNRACGCLTHINQSLLIFNNNNWNHWKGAESPGWRTW